MDSKIKLQRGSPYPLGVSNQLEGLNFALYSEQAEEVTLCLFKPGKEEIYAEISLNPQLNRTGNIWHVLLENLQECFEYAYKISQLGPFLDPYARSLSCNAPWGMREKFLRGRALTAIPFDWQGDSHPRIPMEDLIIYEMHIRGLTQHPSSKVSQRGTYLGVIEKIPYLLELGINAVELLPIHAFDETDNQYVNPLTGRPLCNFWGYAPLNYFSVMNHYSSKRGWGEEIREFKEMVRSLHRAGIEVILDVVFNHTGEGPVKALSFRGIDENTYYLKSVDRQLLDFSGCGNTLNSNHPTVSALILDALRYYVEELHIDGFRFDLASTFCRTEEGAVLTHPPIISAINADPVLAQTKLIAEAWDAAGLYQVGHFPGGMRWAQWNGHYRDVVRCFIKGTNGVAEAFATALCGSENLFGQGLPTQSINFVTAHDGFTLCDLVSFQQKHNEENGEDNRDGSSWDMSWNCGMEGPTDDWAIRALRKRQMRNFLVALFVSIGTPMLLMGDEYGHSRKGNNNAYCHDDEKNYFLWDALADADGYQRFARLLIHWRRRLPHFRRRHFLTAQDVIWHGQFPESPNWSETSRLVVYQLKEPTDSRERTLFPIELYIAFNAHYESVLLHLPLGNWHRLIDTSLPSPDDIVEDFPSAFLPEGSLEIGPYSSIMLSKISNTHFK